MRSQNLLKLITFISFLIFSSISFAETSSPLRDTVITTKIKAKIALDKTISIFDIGVSTNQGIVTLSGTVDSSSEEKAIVELAKKTDGVVKVNSNDLSVTKSAHPFKDSLITAKVKGIFLKEKLFGKKIIPITQISVETNNGIVYLSGHVKTSQEAENAIDLSKKISGVKDVISRLVVENSVS